LSKIAIITIHKSNKGERKMFCQKCGCSIPEGAQVCPRCGTAPGETKFCQHCGAVIDKECVVCPKCGKQVADLRQPQYQQPNIIINNANNNVNTANANSFGPGRMKNKWVALVLCFFLGGLGIHKFYEGKVGMGILYILTVGLVGIGWLVDLIVILFKPNPYYV